MNLTLCFPLLNVAVQQWTVGSFSELKFGLNQVSLNYAFECYSDSMFSNFLECKGFMFEVQIQNDVWILKLEICSFRNLYGDPRVTNNRPQTVVVTV